MSNASLKDQLLAVAAQISDTKTQPTMKKHQEKPTKSLKPRPEKSNKQMPPKPKWLEFAQYGVELLRVYFPACFKLPSEMKPLKIGIKQDLLKQLSTIDTIVTEDKACMVKSLAYYVNTAAYHRTVVDGATRIDLEGKPAGVVTSAEAQYSNERQLAKQQRKLSAASLPKPVKELEINKN